MRVWMKIAALSAVVAVSVGVGMTVADAGGPPFGTVAADRSAPDRTVRDLGGGTTETKYVAKVPCRIVDTRNGGGGPISNNQTRTFHVTGNGVGFVTQGGNPGGCGIPAGASSIEATVTAVDSDSGYLRIFPSNFVEPNATFINYSPYDPSNTGSITLCQSGCPSGGEISVRGHGGTTQLVIDVQGYYVKPLSVEVNDDGTLARGSRYASTVRNSTGYYTVKFDRNVSGCTFGASTRHRPRVAAVQATVGDNTKVDVIISDYGNSLADDDFYLTVTC